MKEGGTPGKQGIKYILSWERERQEGKALRKGERKGNGEIGGGRGITKEEERNRK